jgi:phosphoribosylaminoimidazole-succinocarboxamide synthase
MELLTCDLSGIKKLASGKVRELFDLGDELLLVATDRISAFDCILPNAIPGKGKVLTQLSAFWFEKLSSNASIPNHLITTDVARYPSFLEPYAALLEGRSMIVKKTKPLPIECVVRGYLAGSGWQEYQEHGTLGGMPLRKGLRQAERLPEVYFTPSTKAAEGHDEPITWEQCKNILGEKIAAEVRTMSLALYEQGHKLAAERGIIIADTKFEFGMQDDTLLLIDECLTPDSSRFWPIDQYRVGENPPSFDKQFVRDYLMTCNWDKKAPAPSLPPEVIAKTAEKYQEAFARLSRN